METELLNPTLYSLLVRRYGEDGIEVVAPGERIDWGLKREFVDPGRTYREGRMSRSVHHSGEEYRLRCPHCKDHRPRMYVNHRWGVWDRQTQSRNLWLIQCFNEQCFDEYQVQEQYFDYIYSIPRSQRKNLPIGEGVEPGGSDGREMAPPGPLWKLDRLKAKYPRHDAIMYLEGRGYDTDRLARLFDVSYCPMAHVYGIATNRIIIPIKKDGVMIGWQARYIGDDVHGRPFNVAGVAKYWTSPGFKRRFFAYNYDRAIRHSTVLIVEGPTDVWSAGVMSMGLLGKTMAPVLRKKFVLGLKKRHGDAARAVIILDPKPDEKRVRKKKPHPIEELRLHLVAGLGSARVVAVYLSEELDPGSCDRDWLWQFCREKARARNVILSFGRPS